METLVEISDETHTFPPFPLKGSKTVTAKQSTTGALPDRRARRRFAADAPEDSGKRPRAVRVRKARTAERGARSGRSGTRDVDRREWEGGRALRGG